MRTGKHEYQSELPKNANERGREEGRALLLVFAFARATIEDVFADE